MPARGGPVCYVAAVHETPSEFARLLGEIKSAAGLSDQQVGEAAGVDRSQVWRWANAGGKPGYEPVRRLAAWLLAERPAAAAMALALLPAAGFETPPGMAPPAPAPAPALAGEGAGKVRAHLHAALDAVNLPLRDQVLAEIAAARERHDGPGDPPAAAFLADPVERAFWESPWRDEEKAAAIAGYRGRLAELGEDDPATETGCTPPA